MPLYLAVQDQVFHHPFRDIVPPFRWRVRDCDTDLVYGSALGYHDTNSSPGNKKGLTACAVSPWYLAEGRGFSHRQHESGVTTRLISLCCRLFSDSTSGNEDMQHGSIWRNLSTRVITKCHPRMNTLRLLSTHYHFRSKKRQSASYSVLEPSGPASASARAMPIPTRLAPIPLRPPPVRATFLLGPGREFPSLDQPNSLPKT